MAEKDNKPSVIKRINNDRLYEKALKLISKPSEKNVHAAKEILDLIPDWKDSQSLSDHCDALLRDFHNQRLYEKAIRTAEKKKEGSYREAIAMLEEIEDSMDVSDLIQEYREKMIKARERDLFKNKLLKGAVGVFLVAAAGTAGVSYFSGSSSQANEDTPVREVNISKSNVSSPVLEGITVPSDYYNIATDSFLTGDGVFKTDDGIIYRGHFENGLASDEGTATLTLPKIGKYTGSFVNGQRSGNGTFKWTDQSEYTGSWKNDKMNGEGVLTLNDGTVYSGIFKNNELSGDATIQYKSKDVYIGQVTYFSRSGLGTYTWADGSTYEGSWKSDKMDGDGILTLADGSTYKGSYSANVLTGTAEIRFANNDSYKGNVTNSKKCGNGTYTWADGASYTGEWDEDTMNGTGTYYYSSNTSGPKLEGTFKNGKPEGTLVYFNGVRSYTTTWLAGICTDVEER